MSEAVDYWLSTYASARESAGGPEPQWLGARRSAALGRLRERGFPTRREEAWKYTNPQRITSVAYRPAPSARVAAGVFEALGLVPSDGPRAVFVNGRFEAELSTLASLPAGLVCETVAAGAVAGADALTPSAALKERPFAALADAFFEDGLSLRAEPGCQIAEPFNALFVSTSGAERGAAAGPDPFASHPRLWVQAGGGSRLEVREVYLAVGEEAHLTNVCAEYCAGDGAQLTRTSIQAEGEAATFLSSVALRADRDARVVNRAFSFGASLAREDLSCELAGDGATCELRGLYLTRDGQHSDHHTTVDHRVPHCSSRQLYRGVLAGRSRAAFTGKVVVHPGAQKSDAQQKNESLLLSERAEADSKPQLEIYADDVKCSHGSTIGQLDPDQIFYLRSRGIDAAQARTILVRGFASAISSQIEGSALREAVEAEISGRLEGGFR